MKNELSFEYNLRERMRTAMKSLETITDGYSSANIILFRANGEKYVWTIYVGKSYGNTTSSEGEVLEVLIDEAIRHHEATTNNKLALLPAPDEE